VHGTVPAAYGISPRNKKNDSSTAKEALCYI